VKGNRRMMRRLRQLGEPLIYIPRLDRKYACLAADHDARGIRRRVLKALLERAGYSLEDVRAADDEELAGMMAESIGDPRARLFAWDATGDWPTDSDGIIDLYAVGKIARGLVARDEHLCALK